MANEKRLDLIDRNALMKEHCEGCAADIQEMCKTDPVCASMMWVVDAPTVDAYTEEQVAGIIKMVDKLSAKANELEKEVVWLKSCLNCKIRKECPRHCGKVVHNCDHWEYGDNAVEVVRCENCQYWNPRYETMGMCMKHNSIVTFTKPDFFCAWGKDKNDGICKED